jgi:alkanesulfonate monooxygenase SsuD/methylene tetrahydromethanopterin reductase-like flavin-dependent oxidoreductase (luciferase family)
MSNPIDSDQATPVTVTFSPEVSQRLRERVEILGVDLEEYVEEALEGSLELEVSLEVECVVFETQEAAEFARDRAAEIDDLPEFKERKIIPYENEGQTGFVIEVEDLEG